MLKSSFLTTALAITAVVVVQGTHISLEGMELRCFTSSASRGDKIIGSTETVPVSDFLKASLHQAASLTDRPRTAPLVIFRTTQFQYNVAESGFFSLCVRNTSPEPVTMVFTYRVESGFQKDLSNLSTVNDANDVLRFAEKLLENTHVIVDRTEAYSTREQLYSHIIEDMNNRIIRWSSLQMVFLICICFFQIYYISSFFEVKSFV